MGVEVTRTGNVARLRLCWPEVRNAMGPAEGRELRLALERTFSEPGLNALLIEAEGRAFSAGGNLKELSEIVRGGEEVVRDMVYTEFQGVFRLLEEAPCVTIAAVDGPAVGFGCDLALACDLTFIGEQGWLAQGWMAAGVIPATGGIRLVSRRAGSQAVWRLLLSKRVDGRSAEALGLGVSVPSAAKAGEEALGQLAEMPTEAVQAMRHLSRISDFDEHLETALSYQARFLASDRFRRRAAELLGDGPG